MSNGRNPKKKGQDTSRVQGGFIALPWSVVDCPAYARLSHPARGLMMELARQYVRDNNGRLLASGAYLAKRGWNSSDVITRAKRELIDSGFIFQTVMGHRPNKASWYALTWYSLDKIQGYDEGAALLFERGAYQKQAPIKKSLTPSGGVERALIAPSRGVGIKPPTPSHGAIRATLDPCPTPSHGNHLETPSPARLKAAPATTATAKPTTPTAWTTTTYDLDSVGDYCQAPPPPPRQQHQLTH